ncbi:MAG: nucleotidyltransferase domain-containing protein [Nanoarchaeota archaeon]|nr:nucleotidyltransferase domain-containing protein [Nanoarchaeota archaeon]
MTRVNNDFHPHGSDLSVREIKDLFKYHFDGVNLQYLTGTKIKDIEIIGSRVWGQPKPFSDLDILVRYEGRANPQDLKDLFAMSNNRLDIGGLETDITFTKDPIEKWLNDSVNNLK